MPGYFELTRTVMPIGFLRSRLSFRGLRTVATVLLYGSMESLVQVRHIALTATVKASLIRITSRHDNGN